MNDMTPMTLDLFSYSALSRDDEVFVRQEAAAIKQRMKRSAEDVVEIGLALMRVKEKLPHGSFDAWREAEFPMSRRAAANFMTIAKVYGGKSALIAHLPVTALLELATAEPEVQAAIEEKLAAGEIVKAADVNALKEEAKATADGLKAAEGEIEKLSEEKRDLLAGAHEQARTEAVEKYEAALKATNEELEKLRQEIARIAAPAVGGETNVAKFPDSRVVHPESARGEDASGGNEDNDVDDAIDLGADESKVLGTYSALMSIEMHQVSAASYWRRMGSHPTTLRESKKCIAAALKIINTLKKGMPNG